MEPKKVTPIRPPELVALTRFVQASFLILNARVFTLTALFMCAAAFAYVLYRPDWIRFAGACAFAAMVFLPCIRLESQSTKPQEQRNDES